MAKKCGLKGAGPLKLCSLGRPIKNRLYIGDVKNVGTELLAEFVKGLAPIVFQRGYRLGDVLCQGDGAEAFNQALALEGKSPLHMICVGYALSQERQEDSTIR